MEQTWMVGSNLFTCPSPIASQTLTNTFNSLSERRLMSSCGVLLGTQRLGVVPDNYLLFKASSGLHLLASSMVSLATELPAEVFTLLLDLQYVLKAVLVCRFFFPAATWFTFVHLEAAQHKHRLSVARHREVLFERPTHLGYSS